MKVSLLLNQESVSDQELSTFRIRHASRGVLIDSESNIALFHYTTQDRYGLPGGGVEEGESFEEAMIRECKEETGCDVEILSELGTVLEVRKNYQMANKSCGFLTRVLGEKGEYVPEGYEEKTETTLSWVPIEQALELIVRNHDLAPLYTQYGIERNTFFLKEAQRLLFH